MYIEPNTIIRIIHNCPLDNTYDHTIYFGSEAAQISYFQDLTKYTFTQQTYQRVQRGRMRVSRKADDLYDCNYLMFQNTNFGSKWFYAFITGVEYINNITAEITFEIDVIQTWWFDFTVEQCFVEREHSITDVPGDNLVPENLQTGDYMTVEQTNTNMFTAWCWCVIASFDENGDDAYGDIYQRVYSGLKYNFFDTPADVSQFLEDNAEKATEGVVTILQIPRFMYTDYSEMHLAPVAHNISPGARPTSFGSYTPKNKKLLTEPYNFLYVTNYNGNSAQYAYEYFNNATPAFQLIPGLNANPTFVLIPRRYKMQNSNIGEVGTAVVGTSETGSELNYDEKITLTGLPHCAYNVDSFKAWLAQNAASLAVNALSTTASFALAASVAAPGVGTLAGAGIGAATSVGNIVSQVYQAAVRPPQANGEQGSITNVNLDLFDFGFYKKQIRPEFARIIDDYFNMYGYATHRVKVPNTHSRPYWNYVKTVGAVITGSVPADDMRSICSIYDKGITFWRNGANVGNYSLDNSPT